MSKTRAHHFHGVDDAMKGLPVSYRSQQSPAAATRSHVRGRMLPEIGASSFRPLPAWSHKLRLSGGSGHSLRVRNPKGGCMIGRAQHVIYTDWVARSTGAEDAIDEGNHQWPSS